MFHGASLLKKPLSAPAVLKRQSVTNTPPPAVCRFCDALLHVQRTFAGGTPMLGDEAGLVEYFPPNDSQWSWVCPFVVGVPPWVTKVTQSPWVLNASENAPASVFQRPWHVFDASEPPPFPFPAVAVVTPTDNATAAQHTNRIRILIV